VSRRREGGLETEGHTKFHAPKEKLIKGGVGFIEGEGL